MAHNWLPDLRLLLQINDPLKTGSDALLDWLLDALVAASNRRLHCILIDPGADVTEQHDGLNQTAIYTDLAPILNVTSLHDDTNRDFGASSLIDPADYYVVADEGRIELMDDRVFGTQFSAGTRNVQVVYRPGLAEDNPALLDMQIAVCKWAAKEFRASEAKLQHVKTTASAGGRALFFEHSMPKDVSTLLDAHRYMPTARAMRR